MKPGEEMGWFGQVKLEPLVQLEPVAYAPWKSKSIDEREGGIRSALNFIRIRAWAVAKPGQRPIHALCFKWG